MLCRDLCCFTQTGNSWYVPVRFPDLFGVWVCSRCGQDRPSMFTDMILVYSPTYPNCTQQMLTCQVMLTAQYLQGAEEPCARLVLLTPQTRALRMRSRKRSGIFNCHICCLYVIPIQKIPVPFRCRMFSLLAWYLSFRSCPCLQLYYPQKFRGLGAMKQFADTDLN